MNRQKFLDIADALFAEARETLHRKGKDYSEESDALAAFKDDGASAGITPFQVWRVHAGKHWRAVSTFIRVGKLESEGLRGRLIDLINYSILFYGLFIDNHIGDRVISQDDAEFVRKALEDATGRRLNGDPTAYGSTIIVGNQVVQSDAQLADNLRVNILSWLDGRLRNLGPEEPGDYPADYLAGRAAAYERLQSHLTRGVLDTSPPTEDDTE